MPTTAETLRPACVLPPVTLRIGAESRATAPATHEHVNPATGRVDALVPLAGPAEVNEAVTAAHVAFALWRATPAGTRAKALLKLAQLVEDNAA